LGASEQGANATHNRWLTIPRTLCFVRNGDDILLMKRAPHRRVFPNKYNGVGGHIERDEDPMQGAQREIKEETGLDVHNLRLCAIHNIDAGESTGIILFVFVACSENRNVVASEDEGTLEWVPVDQAHTLDLVEDLPIVLDKILHMPENAPPYFVHVSYNDDDVIQMAFNNGKV